MNRVWTYYGCALMGIVCASSTVLFWESIVRHHPLAFCFLMFAISAIISGLWNQPKS